MILSQMILPKQLSPDTKDLYYRGSARCTDNGLALNAASRITFDTYFNAFYYGPYLQYTKVENVRLIVETSGTLALDLISIDSSCNEKFIASIDASGERARSEFPPCVLSDLPPDGAIFLRAEANGEAIIHGGSFETDTESDESICVAAVICTYKREEYVTRNVETIRRDILDNTTNPIHDNLDVFVVDNGKILPPSAHERVMVFPNKNLGGSGGFTRGLIEAYERRDKYTHVLFMDDDISFEAEVFCRTVQFLKVAKETERPLCIGGQMLIEDKPTIQHESGGSYIKGRLVPNNQGLDLSKREHLMQNILEKSVQYNAWWYFCFPISVVDEYGLPLPLFIKTDDVEYGLRIKPQLVLLNGIGVWHMAFSDKYSPHLEYYIKRNELIVSAIHGSGAGIGPSLWKLIRAAGKAILIGNPKTVDFLLMAYRDFLKGPKFLMEIDGEELNKQLLAERDKPAKNRMWSVVSDSFRCVGMCVQVLWGYKRARTKYMPNIDSMSSFDCWSDCFASILSD